ncbi:MAG: GGDEF domain-containing protein [Eubacterium sp.]|nr:GGDEF domain-containing protein [Eubacterium sp.]
MNSMEDKEIFVKIAEALLVDYSSIYYVNAVTKRYKWYSINSGFKSLGLEFEGDDFFKNVSRDAIKVVYPEDVQLIVDFLSETNVMNNIRTGEMKSILYRLIIDGKPVYHTMRLIKGIGEDSDYFIVGVLNVDEKIRKEQAAKEMEEKSLTYNQIAMALATRLDAVYYVDANTLSYVEYTCSNEDSGMEILAEGDDFFEEFGEEVRTKVVPEDRVFMTDSLSAEKLNSLRETGDIQKFNFRILRNGAPVYMSYRMVWAADGRHFIVGISNIDSQVRKEKDYVQAIRSATEMAERDGLTGVKNMTAYQKMEDLLQKGINVGSQEPFAIVVCDVNGLKEVNDTFGHKAGDDYICSACAVVCSSFQHSPVFRIGGDEFCAVLRGSDYENRESLLDGLRVKMAKNITSGDVVLASGMSAFEVGQDKLVSQIFKRADNMMYENKRQLKQNS